MTTYMCMKVYEPPLYSFRLTINENLFVISKKVKHSLLLSVIRRSYDEIHHMTELHDLNRFCHSIQDKHFLKHCAAHIGYFEIKRLANHLQHPGDGESVCTHTQVATVFITFALSTSVMFPLFRFPSVIFPNLEGRSALVLHSTETGALDILRGIGVDVLLYWEEQQTSEASPDEDESSVNVDWDESSDSSSVNESLWDFDGLDTFVKQESGDLTQNHSAMWES